MLNEVLEYSKRLPPIKPGFSVKSSKWAIIIDNKAEICGMVSLGDGNNGKTFSCCPEFTFSEMIAGSIVRSQFLIESFVGDLGMGDVMVGFDKDAFQSFGLKQSLNAASSELTAKSYTEALNHLISEQSVRLVNSLAIHWFGHEIKKEDDMFAELENPSEPLAGQATRPKQLLDAIKSGQRPDLLDNYYYVATVSGQAGRVMVRDWQQGQLAELLENISAWFDDLQIITRDGSKLAAPPKFLAVVGCLVRDLKDAPAPLITELWRTALNKNKLIPYTAFTQALLESRKAIINEEAQIMPAWV